MDTLISPADGTPVVHRTFPCVAPGRAVGTALLVHGTALSQATWRGFGYVRALTRTHTVITVDLRGHGRSGGPHQPSAYGMDFFVADLLAVLDQTRSNLVDYVGYSLGGRIGFSLAVAAPARLNRFVSIAGAPGAEPGAFDRLFFPGCITTLREHGMDGFLSGWQNRTGERLDGPTRHAFAANDPLALAASMEGSGKDPGIPDDLLAGITAPIQLIVGSQDPARLSSAERVRTVLPESALLVVDGATHGDVLRRPQTLAAVTGFLTTAADNPV